jgi:hypothetical protein
MHIVEPDIKPAPAPPTVTVSFTLLPEPTLAEFKVDMSFQPDTVTMNIEVTRGVFKPENHSHANAYLQDGGAEQIRTRMRQSRDFIGKLEL